MNLKILFFIKVILLLAAQAFGQTKYEKEYRLKLQEVPLDARKFVEALPFSEKVKWYFEENLKGNSIEAKVTSNQKRYSLEFDTLGNLQDVEVQIDWMEIPEASRNNISETLGSQYSDYKINKIQVQYTGEVATLLSLLKNQKTNNWYSTKYEIIVKGKKNKQLKLYEITFSQTGGVITIAEVIFRNIDNLAF